MKILMRTLAVISNVLLLGLAGCGQKSASFSLTNTTQSFHQSPSTLNNKIDILWVVDNSGSMGPLQNNLTSNFNTFISNFQTKNYDFHMSVTTTDAYRAEANFVNNATLSKFRDGTDATSHTGIFVMLPATLNLSNVFLVDATQGANGSGDERAFSSFRDSLNNTMNTGFLRSNSFLAVIILSDEDDFSSASRSEGSWMYRGGVPDHDYTYSGLDTVDSYINYLDTLTQTTGALRRYNVSAITVLDNACMNSHISQSPTTIVGTRYIDMAQKTNGVLGSVCNSSYANDLALIQNKIAELSSQFYLARVPVPSTIVVTVNGAVIPQDPSNGWTYDPASNSIIFHGSALPTQSSTINVDFTPASVM